ncbi:hypothetical protein D3C84_1082610 [compost metagenome]
MGLGCSCLTCSLVWLLVVEKCMLVSVDWCVSGCCVCCVIKVAVQLSLLSFFGRVVVSSF